MRDTAVRRFKKTIDIQSSLLKRLRAHRYFTIVWLCGALLLTCFLHIWQRVRVLDLVTEVSQLRKENGSLQDNLKKTGSDLASLSMSSRIKKYATDSLGMKSIDPDRLYTLSPSDDGKVDLDEIDKMVTAIKRVADYVPVLSENSANAGELRIIRIDSADHKGERR